MVGLDPAHLVGAGGAVGALLRAFVSRRIDVESFPLGTVTVNVVGTFFLGLFTFLSLDRSAMLLLGTGACGSFTTFSTFSFDTVRLWETGDRLRAVVNAVGTLAAASLALGLAWLVARGLG